MKYLNKFNSISELNEFKNGDNYLTPNISLCNNKIEIDSKNSISCTFDIATGGETTLVSPNAFKSFILDGVEQIHSNPTVHTVKNNLQFEYAGVTSSYKIKPITPLIRINEEFTVENLRVGIINQNGNAVGDSLLDPMMIHGNIVNIGMLAVQSLGNTDITSCYCVLFDQIQNHIYDQTIINADGSEYHFEPIEIPVETVPILPSEFMMSQESIMTSLMNFQQQFKFKLDNFQSGTIAVFIQLGEQMEFLPYDEGLFSYDGTYYTLSDGALMSEFGMIFALVMPAFGATTSLEDITTGWLPIEIHYGNEVIVPEPVPYGQQLTINSAHTFSTDVIEVKLYSDKQPTHILGLVVTTDDNKEIFVSSWSEYIGDENYVDENIYKPSSPLMKQFNSSTAKKLFVLSTSTSIKDIIPDALVEYKFVTSDFSNLVNLESGEHTLDITIADGVNPVLDFNTNLTSIIWNTDKCNLGFNQFRYCTKLQKVRLPDSVKYIPPYCFYTAVDINLPSSLEVLGTYCCYNRLDYVFLPESLKVVDYRALYNSTITRLPENIENCDNIIVNGSYIIEGTKLKYLNINSSPESCVLYNTDVLYNLSSPPADRLYYRNGFLLDDFSFKKDINLSVFNNISILRGVGVRIVTGAPGHCKTLYWTSANDYFNSNISPDNFSEHVDEIKFGSSTLSSNPTNYTFPANVSGLNHAHLNGKNFNELTIPTDFGTTRFCGHFHINTLKISDISVLQQYYWIRGNFANTWSNDLNYSISVDNLMIDNVLVTDLEIPSDITINSHILPRNLNSLTIKSGAQVKFHAHKTRIAENIYIEDFSCLNFHQYGIKDENKHAAESSPFSYYSTIRPYYEVSKLYYNGELLEHVNHTGNLGNGLSNNPQIKTIILNDSYVTVHGFSNCNNLLTLVANNCSFGSHCFFNCKKLESVDILFQSDDKVPDYLFRNCNALHDIKIRNTNAPTLYSSYSLQSMPTTGVLKVPSGSDYSSWLAQLGSGWTIEYFDL